MAKTSKTMLNSSGESGHPYLVPDFRGNAFNFSPLRIMFAEGLSYILFIIGEGNGTPLQYSCLENPWTEEPGRLQSMGSLSQTRLSDFTFTFHFRALEEELATHSSILA